LNKKIKNLFKVYRQKVFEKNLDEAKQASYHILSGVALSLLF